MHHGVPFHWFATFAIAVVLFGVFLTMGYGLIGLAFLFFAGSMLGGALMSYLRPA